MSTEIAISIVAIITAIGAAGAILFKHVKKSDCFCLHFETRSPTTENPVLALPTSQKRVRKNGISEEPVDNEEFKLDNIVEVEV